MIGILTINRPATRSGSIVKSFPALKSQPRVGQSSIDTESFFNSPLRQQFSILSRVTQFAIDQVNHQTQFADISTVEVE